MIVRRTPITKNSSLQKKKLMHIATGMHRKDYLHLKDPMQQHWNHFKDEVMDYYYDQYGFFIHIGENYFLLYWKGEKVRKTKTLEAAKLISNILINDYLT